MSDHPTPTNVGCRAARIATRGDGRSPASSQPHIFGGVPRGWQTEAAPRPGLRHESRILAGCRLRRPVDASASIALGATVRGATRMPTGGLPCGPNVRHLGTTTCTIKDRFSAMATDAQPVTQVDVSATKESAARDEPEPTNVRELGTIGGAR